MEASGRDRQLMRFFDSTFCDRLRQEACLSESLEVEEAVGPRWKGNTWSERSMTHLYDMCIIIRNGEPLNSTIFYFCEELAREDPDMTDSNA